MPCGHRITYDTNRLTSGSHQPLESRVTLIGDTSALRSPDATAKSIGVSHSTAFNMRHKLLVFPEKVMENMPPLEAVIEADETYILESQKGTSVTPSSEDLVEALGKHISGHSVILCDGASGYNLPAEKTGRTAASKK